MGAKIVFRCPMLSKIDLNAAALDVQTGSCCP
jgi:hypothetical protein